MKKVILCVAISLLIMLPVSGQEKVERDYLEGPILLNTLLGFGLGSLAQGDRNGAFLQLLGEMCGWGMVALGFMPVNMVGDYSILIPSLAVAIGARFVWGICRPIWFYNHRIKPHRSEDVAIYVVPSITSSANHRRFRTGVELQFRYDLK
jgi:hypothetical protein